MTLLILMLPDTSCNRFTITLIANDVRTIVVLRIIVFIDFVLDFLVVISLIARYLSTRPIQAEALDQLELTLTLRLIWNFELALKASIETVSNRHSMSRALMLTRWTILTKSQSLFLQSLSKNEILIQRLSEGRVCSCLIIVIHSRALVGWEVCLIDHIVRGTSCVGVVVIVHL